MKIFKIFLLSFASTSLFATEKIFDFPINQRILSIEKQEYPEKERPEKSMPFQKEVRAATCSYPQTVQYPPFYYPSSAHWLSSLSILGDSLEIEDGSFWKIASTDQYKILYWQTSDPLVVTQNTNWFSYYDYKIINKADGTTVYANLFIGPVIEGEHTHRIIEIDYLREKIILEDYSHWRICSADLYLFEKWALEDTVIIGMNSGWYSSCCEFILINVNMNNFIRASQH